MCKLFKQVGPYKYEKPLEYKKLSGTLYKTDIAYRLLCTFADTDQHGLKEEMDCQYRKVKLYLQ